jgi:hypothetical protein
MDDGTLLLEILGMVAFVVTIVLALWAYCKAARNK